MICCFPFCEADVKDLKLLLSWVKTLGGCRRHAALLVADAALDWLTVLEMQSAAKESFRTCHIVTNDAPTIGWPAGPNSLFLAAAKYLSKFDSPWFWCETDCIPIKEGWLDALENAYKAAGKRFVGALVKDTRPESAMPPTHLAGCALYPPDAITCVGPFCTGNLAWDMASAHRVVPEAAHTNLIQSFWGQQGLPPTFRDSKFNGCAINTFTLENLHQEAVVFHRNKDGSLIRLLWKKISPKTYPENPEFTVVIPFHNGDAQAAIDSLKWQVEMGCPRRYNCLLAFDNKVLKQYVQSVIAEATKVYVNIDKFTYPAPPIPSWPVAANHAFFHTARFAKNSLKRAWLWMEPDMVPLKKNWLERLQEEYQNCGKKIMGSIVPGMGHVNGTAVYPADFIDMVPKAASTQSGAFDTNIKEETIRYTHNAIHLMQHAWGMQNGEIHPVVGEAPSFKTAALVRKLVHPDAVTFHRCKDGSLISRMREMARKK